MPRMLAVLGIVGVVAVVALIVVRVTMFRSVDWGLVGAPSPTTLEVAAPGFFAVCDQLEVEVVRETPSTVELGATVRLGSCTSKVGHQFAPQTVRLDHPIGGRRITGGKKTALSNETLPVAPSEPRTVPSVVGLSRDDARLAMGAVGIARIRFAGDGATATGQTPAAGRPAYVRSPKEPRPRSREVTVRTR